MVNANCAVIETGGKQYLVRTGQQLSVEKLSGGIKELPNLLTGKMVPIIVIKNYKGAKVRILKFRAKTRYKRTRGHRQNYTKIKIGAI